MNIKNLFFMIMVGFLTKPTCSMMNQVNLGILKTSPIGIITYPACNPAVNPEDAREIELYLKLVFKFATGNKSFHINDKQKNAAQDAITYASQYYMSPSNVVRKPLKDYLREKYAAYKELPQAFQHDVVIIASTTPEEQKK